MLYFLTVVQPGLVACRGEAVAPLSAKPLTIFFTRDGQHQPKGICSRTRCADPVRAHRNVRHDGPVYPRSSRLPTWPPLAWAATLTIAVGVVYLLAVRTQWGQHLDQRAYQTLLGTGESADLPHVVGLGSITDYRLWMVAAASIVGLGIVAGRRWSLPPLLLLPIAGILLAQFLRDEVLLRPDFVGDGWLSNTFPSGHAAAAAGCLSLIHI